MTSELETTFADEFSRPAGVVPPTVAHTWQIADQGLERPLALAQSGIPLQALRNVAGDIRESRDNARFVLNRRDAGSHVDQ